jgi:hypothetical protein
MSQIVKDIHFSSNWNNKLYCNFISTIRFGVNKISEGDTVNILLRKKGVYINTGKAKCYKVFNDIKFNDIYWYICIDTGYSYEESFKLFTQINHNVQIDENTVCNLLIFHRHEPIILNKI